MKAVLYRRAVPPAKYKQLPPHNSPLHTTKKQDQEKDKDRYIVSLWMLLEGVVSYLQENYSSNISLEKKKNIYILAFLSLYYILPIPFSLPFALFFPYILLCFFL